MTAEATYRFWERGQSGSVFAVRFDERGRLTGCHGPLVSNEIRSNALPSYPYDDRGATLARLEAQREQWTPFDF